jgi:hypothetical protein
MSAGTLPLHIEQGASFERTFTITDDGVALDLTGYTAKFQIRTAPDADGALVSVPSGDPGLSMVITPLAGQILVSISDAVTQEFAVGSPTRLGPQALGVWSLEITSSTGFVTRLLEGAVTISTRVILP